MAKSKKAQRQLVLELAANLNPAVEAATAALTGCQYGVIRAELRHVEAASEEQYQEDANAESIRRVKAMEVECEESKFSAGGMRSTVLTGSKENGPGRNSKRKERDSRRNVRRLPISIAATQNAWKTCGKCPL